MEYLITVLLLFLSALFSGLNLGLMSLGPHALRRKMELGDERAAKVYEVRRNGNLLLVTLLLGNVLVNSVLAVYLGSITTGLLAVIITTALITLLGEIIPQAVLSRYALTLGSKVVWVVQIFMFLLYPVCKPIAWVLNKTLGEELPILYSKQELMNILEEHSENTKSEIEAHEEKIARGALTFGDKSIEAVMTPRSVVTFLRKSQRLSERLVKQLKEQGFTRYPVLEDDADNEQAIGMLYVKDLVGLKSIKTVGEVAREKITFINEEDMLDDALQTFLKTKQHLFLVVNQFEEIVGVVSIEDVLEEILGDEIVDEFDKHDDLRAVALKRVG
ncbi:DUF21 domain-containing protein [Candidatus Saccharibacteria bacterium]|nr:DUF21 domain-containing protein [Candidatus Saccharibacteria bacterium]